MVQCFFATACSWRSGVKVHSFSRTSTLYALRSLSNTTIPAGKYSFTLRAGRPSPVKRSLSARCDQNGARVVHMIHLILSHTPRQYREETHLQRRFAERQFHYAGGRGR